MATNYKAEGNRFTYTNETSTDIASGDVIESADRIFIALDAIAAGASGTVIAIGVFTVPKTTGEAWVLGTQLYYVTSTAKLSTTAGSNIKAGYAAAAAASGDTTGRCKINA